MRAETSLPYFFFGTLMDPDVLAIVLGRAAASIEHEAARLDGYRRHRVFGESYPILRPAPDTAVDGLLVPSLSPGEAARVAFYEGEEYRPVPLTVVSASGPRDALVFVDDGGLSTDGEWDFERWRREEKAALLAAAHAFMSRFGKIDGRDSADAEWRAAKGLVPTR